MRRFFMCKLPKAVSSKQVLEQSYKRAFTLTGKCFSTALPVTAQAITADQANTMTTITLYKMSDHTYYL